MRKILGMLLITGILSPNGCNLGVSSAYAAAQTNAEQFADAVDDLSDDYDTKKKAVKDADKKITDLKAKWEAHHNNTTGKAAHNGSYDACTDNTNKDANNNTCNDYKTELGDETTANSLMKGLKDARDALAAFEKNPLTSLKSTAGKIVSESEKLKKIYEFMKKSQRGSVSAKDWDDVLVKIGQHFSPPGEKDKGEMSTIVRLEKIAKGEGGLEIVKIGTGDNRLNKEAGTPEPFTYTKEIRDALNLHIKLLYQMSEAVKDMPVENTQDIEAAITEIAKGQGVNNAAEELMNFNPKDVNVKLAETFYSVHEGNVFSLVDMIQDPKSGLSAETKMHYIKYFNDQMGEVMRRVSNEGDRATGMGGYAKETAEAGHALQTVYNRLYAKIHENANRDTKGEKDKLVKKLVADSKKLVKKLEKTFGKHPDTKEERKKVNVQNIMKNMENLLKQKEKKELNDKQKTNLFGLANTLSEQAGSLNEKQIKQMTNLFEGMKDLLIANQENEVVKKINSNLERAQFKQKEQTTEAAPQK